jgi:hypothetical protein
VASCTDIASITIQMLQMLQLNNSMVSCEQRKLYGVLHSNGAINLLSCHFKHLNHVRQIITPCGLTVQVMSLFLY